MKLWAWLGLILGVALTGWMTAVIVVWFAVRNEARDTLDALSHHARTRRS